MAASSGETTVTMKQEGVYLARFFVSYELGGRAITRKSGNFPITTTRTVKAPAGATNIQYWAQFRGLFQWYTIGDGKVALEPGHTVKLRLTGPAFRRWARMEILDERAPFSGAPAIEHVIVLMMENRSFDHMFGFLDHPNPEFEKLARGQFENRAEPGGPAFGVSDEARYEIRSPSHSHRGVMQQMLGNDDFPEDYQPEKTGDSWGERGNKGFARNYHLYREGESGEGVMRCFDERKIPVLASLAKQYGLFTRWFSSVPGATLPNRHYALAGTSHGRANNGKVLSNLSRSVPTILDEMEKQRRSWKVYFGDFPHALFYHSLALNLGRRFLPHLPRLGRHPILNDIEYHGRRHRLRRHRLPHVSWIEPRYSQVGKYHGNSHHPGQAPTAAEFIAGEQLIADIHNALLKTLETAENKEESLYAKTLFIVTYDEHGGFFDHVAPPETVSPDDVPFKDGAYQFDFDLLGPRVPAILMSPWIKKGVLINEVMDHTSISAGLHELFGARRLGKRADQAAPFWRQDWGEEVLSSHVRTDLQPVQPVSRAEEPRDGGGVGDMPEPAAVEYTEEDNEYAQYVLARQLEQAMDGVFDRSGDPMLPPELLPGDEERARLYENVIAKLHAHSGRTVEIVDAAGFAIVESERARQTVAFAELWELGAIELLDDQGNSLVITPTIAATEDGSDDSDDSDEDGSDAPTTGAAELGVADRDEIRASGIAMSELERAFQAFRDNRLDDIRSALA